MISLIQKSKSDVRLPFFYLLKTSLQSTVKETWPNELRGRHVGYVTHNGL